MSFLQPSLGLDDHQRPPKTAKHTDDVRRQELCRNYHLSASELKEMHQDHLGNVSIRFIEHRPKKVLKISSQRAASKTLLTSRKRKNRLQFALRYLHWSVDNRSCGLMNPPFSASPATNIGILVQKSTPEFFPKPAVSMTKRLESVFKANGHTTKCCIDHVYWFCMSYYTVLPCFMLIF